MGRYESLKEELDKAEDILSQIGHFEFRTSVEATLWSASCEKTLWALYGGRHSEQAKTFRITVSLLDRVNVIKGFLAVEEDLLRGIPSRGRSGSSAVNVNVTQTNDQRQVQHQTTSVTQEFTMRLMLKIDHATDLTDEQKGEVKKLHADLLEELHKPETNWQKVTGFLKNGFDFGMKYGPEMVKLADAFYGAK